MTIREALTHATEQLSHDPDLVSTASRDAELLLLHTLALTRTILYIDPYRSLTPAQHSAFTAAIARRLAHEPIQYITGTQEFFGLALCVTPATLIPRPETELLVEAALNRLSTDRPLRLADIGTGSGAIAIALATRLPRAEILAIDLSPAALSIARENAQTHQVANRIHFVQDDLLTQQPGRFDAILANLPYIPDSDRPSLHPQVRDHEPATALFAGPDGLDLYRRLIPQAAAALAPGGVFALEFGLGQRETLAHLLAGWPGLQFLDDLQGISRIALAHTS